MRYLRTGKQYYRNLLYLTKLITANAKLRILKDRLFKKWNYHIKTSSYSFNNKIIPYMNMVNNITTCNNGKQNYNAKLPFKYATVIVSLTLHG